MSWKCCPSNGNRYVGTNSMEPGTGATHEARANASQPAPTLPERGCYTVWQQCQGAGATPCGSNGVSLRTRPRARCTVTTGCWRQHSDGQAATRSLCSSSHHTRQAHAAQSTPPLPPPPRTCGLCGYTATVSVDMTTPWPSAIPRASPPARVSRHEQHNAEHAASRVQHCMQRCHPWTPSHAP